MITLYTMTSTSPNVRKVLIMLAETGLSYTVKRMEKQSDGNLPDDFTAINPNATIPAIVDHDSGNAIFESGAILYYLAEKTRSFMPTNIERRGEVIKWVMFEVANMGPVMGELYHYMLMEPDEIQDIHVQRYKDKLARYCSILNQQLEGRDYLCGEYSIADIALYPWSAIFEDMAEINLNDFAHLKRWVDAIGKHPAAHLAL